MNIVADLHTHTIASGHAYSTINELAREAADKKLLALALTDHGPALPGGPHLYHFGALRFVPKVLFGVRIFSGVEANILNIDGNLDLPDSYLHKLDFVMAGFHEECGFVTDGKEDNTRALVNVMSNPLVHAVSHPGNPVFPVDKERVVAAAVATGTALEINNSSFSISREGSRTNCEELAHLIARNGAPVMVGSDAHIAQGVGDFTDAVQVLVKAGVYEEQVINTSLSRLLEFLQHKG